MRTSKNHGNRRKAEEAYSAVRREAMLMLQPELQQTLKLNIYLTNITPDALEIAVDWDYIYSCLEKTHHKPAWDWVKELKKFRRRPRRVELAIWCEQQLCGLALGRISDRCIVATIHLIEANPDDHPLKGKIIPVATRYLEVLATSLKAREISIEQPIPDLIEYYKSIGFDHEIKKGRKIMRLKK